METNEVMKDEDTSNTTVVFKSKYTYVIFLLLTMAIGCHVINHIGKSNSNANRITYGKTSEPDEFCIKLDHKLYTQLQLLDNFRDSIIDADSIEVTIENFNDRIFTLLSSTIKNYEFHPFTPSDSTRIFSTISIDKCLALYSWDTRLGGTMRRYTTCAIFKANGRYQICCLEDKIHDKKIEDFSELDYASYSDIYSVMMKNGQIIYLASGGGKAQTLSPWRTIKALKISDSIERINIFPNDKSELFCEFDFTFPNPSKLPDSVVEIYYLEDKMRMQIPLIKDGRPTGKYTKLTFDGNHFK